LFGPRTGPPKSLGERAGGRGQAGEEAAQVVVKRKARNHGAELKRLAGRVHAGRAAHSMSHEDFEKLTVEEQQRIRTRGRWKAPAPKLTGEALEVLYDKHPKLAKQIVVDLVASPRAELDNGRAKGAQARHHQSVQRFSEVDELIGHLLQSVSAVRPRGKLNQWIAYEVFKTPAAIKAAGADEDKRYLTIFNRVKTLVAAHRKKKP
jgi:hypothetical protein